MNNIKENLQKNEKKIRLGEYIHFESYVEIMVLILDEFKKNIKKNNDLIGNIFPDYRYSEYIEGIEENLYFLQDLISSDIANKELDFCDFLVKYND